MDTKDFNKIVDMRCDKIKKILVAKAAEYSNDGDRLYNFKAGAQISGKPVEETLWGYATKHILCVRDMCEGKLEANEYMIDEKIGDAINYLILLEAVLREKLDR